MDVGRVGFILGLKQKVNGTKYISYLSLLSALEEINFFFFTVKLEENFHMIHLNVEII